MRRKVRIIIGLAVALCLIGCARSNTENETSEKVVYNNGAEEVMAMTEMPEPTVTEMAEPTVTEMPEPTATEMAEPTATEMPEPTATEMPEPTATNTPTPTPVVVTENATAFVFSLPDSTSYTMSNVWAESEINLILRCPASVLPKEGKLTTRFAYPKNGKSTNAGISVEVFIGESWVTFSPANISMVRTTDDRWSVFSHTVEYELKGDICEITIKTHSGQGEGSIPFALTGLFFEDMDTGEKKQLNLQDPALEWICRRYISSEKIDYEWVMLQTPVKEIIPALAPIPTSAPMPTSAPIPTSEPVITAPVMPEIPPVIAGGADEKYITYQLPESETGWHAAWEESESNIIMLYKSDKALTQGTVYARLYIPKLSGVNRTDAFELAVHAQNDFMNFSGDRIDVVYSGNKTSAMNKALTDKGNHYEIVFAVPYDSSKVANGNELKIIFKTHCDTAHGAYEISFCDVIVSDAGSGEHLIDFSKDSVRVMGEMYVSKAQVPFRYTKEPASPTFYIANAVDKLPIGSTYQVLVNSSGKAKLRFDSSDTSIATIDNQGKVVTHKPGRCRFTVTDEASGESKSFMVSIDTPKITPVTYEILMIAGSSAKLEFTTEFTTKEGKYQYHSSNAEIVKLEADGSAKALQAGVVTITVEDTVNEIEFAFELEVYAPKDPDGVAKYLSLGHTHLVTVDIAKRSYDLIYAVYRNVFDYFNYGKYEPVVLNFTVGDYSPAYSNMIDIFLASEHMLANAKDVDCITHELIHCAQNYPNVNEYVWLMEGLTDYGRYLFGLHNEDCGWHLTEYQPGQHYTNSYTVTANFIKYITENYCSQMPILINEMFKSTTGYQDSIWKENTGYTLDELWDLYANAS